jgi:hypothetical protein
VGIIVPKEASVPGRLVGEEDGEHECGKHEPDQPGLRQPGLRLRAGGRQVFGLRRCFIRSLLGSGRLCFPGAHKRVFI